MKQEIPVLLLTGYLGSGKTTLLNRILNNKKDDPPKQDTEQQEGYQICSDCK